MEKLSTMETRETLTTKIPPWSQKYLTSEDLQQISAAIATAELSTSGEIVPMIVQKSCSTGHVRWLLFLILSFLFFGIQIAFYWTPDALGPLGLVPTQLLYLLLLFFIAQFLSTLTPLQRWLIPPKDRQQQTHLRAQLEFYNSKIQSTADATGVLIFISLMERNAIVLADKKISHQLSPSTWELVLHRILHGIKQGQMSSGICAGIAECGKILMEKFPIAPEDVNELPNQLIIKE